MGARRLLAPVLSFLLLLPGCITTTRMADKLQNRGQYDASIEASIKVLQRKPANRAAAEVLASAYEQAQDRDARRVEFLLLEEREANWPEILSLYESMNRRQERVRSAPGESREGLVFESYAPRIVEARGRSMEFLLREGGRLLGAGSREQAREAAGLFEQALNIFPESREAADGLDSAERAGRTHVLLSFSNESGKILPEASVSELREIPLEQIGSRWAAYHLDADSTTVYDYLVLARLVQVDMSPERMERNTFTETDVIIDRRGTVVDSSGVEREIERRRTVTAEITTLTLTKQARIALVGEIRELASGRLVERWERPLSADFEDRSMVFTGDLEAVPAPWRDLAGKKPREFPSDEQLFAQAVSILKSDFVKTLRSERSSLERIP